MFFKKVHAFILENKIDNSHIIIAGDFNCNVDKIKTGASKDPSEKYFTKLMSSFSLLDMWGHCHPNKPAFTYTSTARRAFYGSRIDYLLVDKKIATNSISCQIESPPVPDHKSLILSIKPAKKRGRGYWTLNNDILHDISFKNKIRPIFRTTVRGIRWGESSTKTASMRIM